ELALPRPLLERLAEKLRRARLHDDLALEVRAGAEAQILVPGPCVAVVAHDAVGDEVAGARRDVVHEELDAERLNRGHPQVALHRLPFELRLSRAEELAAPREMRALLRNVRHVLPPASREEAMFPARDERRAVGERHAKGGLECLPVREDLRLRVAAILAV